MAGAGYKLFNTGDVLTAAQVNTYLQEQVVMVFANAAARTTALSGVLAEGMVSYLKDTDALEIYSGAAWVGYGSGDITGVTAGTGISGGGTSGTVTITNSMATEITAAGDIIVGTGSGTFDNLPIGTTGQVLTADTTVSPYKVKWAAAASGGGMTLLDSGSFTGASVTTATLSTSYNDLYVVVRNFQPVSNARLQVRFNGDSAANYSDNGIDYDSYAYSQTQHNEVGMIQLSSNTTSLITFNVPDYANTSTYKILFVPSAVVANVTTPANAQYTAGRISAWKSTAAVTSLTFFCSTGNFTAGTYRVYGVK
jgi:hypothetical protein